MFEQENSQWHDRAYLVYDKQNRTFYPFFKRDNNEKYYTIFQINADNSSQNIEVSVKRFKPNGYNSTKTSKDITAIIYLFQ